jgi:hypothetical protein
MLRRQSSEGETIIDCVPEGFDRNDLFFTHMKYWLKRMDNPLLPPLCAFDDGVAALKVALGAREAGLHWQAVRF